MKYVISIVLIVLLIPTSIAALKKQEKPNIILIMADDLGYECLKANGSTSYQTPELDQLASGGMRFTHCYSQPLCTPSRVKIMTGISNDRNYVEFGTLDRKQVTFAHLFQKAGYATCVAGKWQLGIEKNSPKHFGFDESYLWNHIRHRKKGSKLDGRYSNPVMSINGEEVEYNNGEFGPDIVSDFVCGFMQRNKEKPFMVYYPMILAHCPFVPTPVSADWDSKSQGSPTYKGDPKNFGGMVSYMDHIVGKIKAKVEELGLDDNTIIIFTGDNGTDEPIVSQTTYGEVIGGKGKMDDTGTHVPCIVYAPGITGGGQVSNDLIDFSDFLPTICEAAGVEVSDNLEIDGRSFYPQLTGERGNPRKWIYCWYSRSGAEKEAKVFARDQQFKLYRNGNYFNLFTDPLEKLPLQKTELSTKEKKTWEMLHKVIGEKANDIKNRK